MRLLLPRFPFLGASAYPHMHIIIVSTGMGEQGIYFAQGLVSNLKFLPLVLYGFNVRLIIYQSGMPKMFPTL